MYLTIAVEWVRRFDLSVRNRLRFTIFHRKMRLQKNKSGSIKIKGRDQYAATAIMFRNMNIIHLNLAVWYAFVSGKELSIFQNVLRNQTSSTPVYFISYIVTDAILSRNRERLAVLYIRRHKSTAHNVFTYTIVFYLITQWQFRTMCLCFNCVGFLHSEFRSVYVFMNQSSWIPSQICVCMTSCYKKSF